MNPVLAELTKSDKFNEYLERIKKSNAPISILGLAGVGAPQLVASTEENIKRKVIVYKSQILIINALIHNGLRFMYSRVRTVIYFLSKSLRTASLGELNGFV